MKNIFILIALLFSCSSSWAKIGFYSGAFDPPTTTDIELVKDCLEQFNLDKLVVLVDRLSTHSECYNASARERVEMLYAELEDLGNRIYIVPEPWSGKELYLNTLRTQDDVHIIEKQEESIQNIPSSTDKIIKNNRLYTSVPEVMIPLKQALHQEAFQAFLREISILFSNENLLNTPIPQFKPLMSNLGFVDQFICTVIKENRINLDRADDFGKKAEKLLISSERDKPYAKLHCLQQSFFYPSDSQPIVALFPFPLPSLPNDQKHSFDVEIYCSDRFPKALFTSHLFQENDVYFHMGSTEESIAYHQSEGFTEIYQVNSQAVRKLRNYHLLRSPATGEIRFIISNLHGEDTLHHIAYQFNEIAKLTKVHLIRHASPSPLFEVDSRFEDITFQSTDTLIIGFKNAISRLLAKNSEWNKMTFSSSGLHVDLYENIRTKNHIILSKCVYGDQLIELLNFFYTSGIRQFQYFGTSGSLSPQIHIGDAVIPLAFSTPQNPFLSFQNKAALLLQAINNERIKLVELHGWTQSPILETENFLQDLQKAGNQSIDVEARYYGEFFHARPDAFASMVLFISDEPFGGITLDHFNTMDQYVDDVFNIVIEPCCGKVLQME